MAKRQFRFSWKISLIGLSLAALLLVASRWQWVRYLEKSKLVSTYTLNAESSPEPLQPHLDNEKVVETLRYRAVQLQGTFNFDQQFVILNQKNAEGPGSLLLTVFDISGHEDFILVSRGFIPFGLEEESSWDEFDFPKGEIELIGVLQPGIGQKSIFHPKSKPPHRNLTRAYLYADLEVMQTELPMPIRTDFYIQQISPAPEGQYPEKAVSIRIPPSTHFGYTIEWALLACIALGASFLFQWKRIEPNKEPP